MFQKTLESHIPRSHAFVEWSRSLILSRRRRRQRWRRWTFLCTNIISDFNNDNAKPNDERVSIWVLWSCCLDVSCHGKPPKSVCHSGYVGFFIFHPFHVRAFCNFIKPNGTHTHSDRHRPTNYTWSVDIDWADLSSNTVVVCSGRHIVVRVLNTIIIPAISTAAAQIVFDTVRQSSPARFDGALSLYSDSTPKPQTQQTIFVCTTSKKQHPI